MADQADADDTGPVATEGSLRMADDEVSVPDIRPMVDQRRQDRIRHARRPDTRPSWLTFKSALPFLAAIGFISYLFLYIFSYGFLAEFGTTPEEVGLNQAAFIVRAAIFGVIALAIGLSLVILAIFFAFLLIGVVAVLVAILEDFIPDNIRRRFNGERFKDRLAAWEFGPNTVSASDAKYLRSETRVLVIGAGGSILMTIALFIQGHAPDNPFVQIGKGIIIFLVFWAILGALASWRIWIAVLILSIALFGSLFDISRHGGQHVARSYLADGRTTDFPLSYVGLQADEVVLEWVGAQRPTTIPDEPLILLGHADGILLLSDGSQLYRVKNSDALVVFCQHAGEKVEPPPAPACTGH